MDERILIVDDEPGMALGMQKTLTRKGLAVDVARDGEDALQRLTRIPYSVVFTDLRMPGLDGHELLRRVRAQSPRTQVVVVTAYGTVESAVACVRDGALDYLLKPFPPDALVRAAVSALRAVGSFPDDDDCGILIAEDPVTLATADLARRAAGSEATILLEAESGAGKEVFAQLIHRESPRRDGPFVAVNCAALPRDLLEAELFGHCRGAFTGAHRDRRGRFQTANGGTLLLDEIGEMNVDLQARLLRVLQDHMVQPVGSDTSDRVDVRVVAATNRDLRRLVAEGRFREDLYYRLRVMPIRIPPLRERPGDIEPLARFFACRHGGPDCVPTDVALDRLRGHGWPGNIRELENVIQRAAILSSGERIEPQHLMLEPPPREHTENEPVSLDDAERDAIRRVLESTAGNRAEAAVALGISPRTLRHKLKRYRDEGRAVPEPVR